jgi:hypothetical protein
MSLIILKALRIACRTFGDWEKGRCGGLGGQHIGLGVWVDDRIFLSNSIPSLHS